MTDFSEITDPLQRLITVEKEYGTRPRVPIGHGEPLFDKHARGQLEDGQFFVWCPIGFIFSWNQGDYDHEYCPWCQMFYTVKSS